MTVTYHPSKLKIQTVVMSLLALVLMLVIFVLDINTNRGLAIGTLYSLVVLYGWLLPGGRITVVIALICSILTIIGFSYSDAGAEPAVFQGINLILALIVIWVSAALVNLADRGYQGLEYANAALELKVEERTAKLRASETSLKKAQEVGKIGHWEWNIDAREVRISDQLFEILKLLKTNEEGLISIDQLITSVHPADFKKAQIAYKQVIDEDQQGITEFRVLSRGRILDVRLEAAVERDERGAIRKLYGIVQDITEQKAVENSLIQHSKELEAKNEVLEQFIYIASHDLQEPLNTVLSLSRLLSVQYGKDMDDQGRKMLGFLESTSSRMRALLTGLLEYGILGKGEGRIVEMVSTNAVLTSVISDLADAIKRSGATVVWSDLPEVYGNSDELRLLFQNLISNAIKFRREGVHPVIDISATDQDDHFEFAIKDNGIGIDQGHFERIFTIFQRLNNRNDFEGIGIGLAHCKKIVEAHNGEIWVSSNIDNGSVFYFTLPKK